MHIRKFGIKLERLKQDQIEMVRHWRNAEEIKSFMEYQEDITPEMQQQWFDSLSPTSDFYFVIMLHDAPVGLIHTSDINWSKKTGHSGLFVWKKELQGSHVPVLASLAMVDFFFTICNLEKLYAKVMLGNKVAVNYNAQLGFRPTEELERKKFIQYRLDKGNYFKVTGHLHKMAESVGGHFKEIAVEKELLNKLIACNAIAESAIKHIVKSIG